jgi:hypothetical protein
MSTLPADKSAPKPAIHSDNKKSALPKRDDRHRHAAPNDPPHKQKGEEPPVG